MSATRAKWVEVVVSENESGDTKSAEVMTAVGANVGGSFKANRA